MASKRSRVRIPPGPPTQPENGSYYVYILQSQKTQRFYIGQTRNLYERLAYHRRYGSPATRGRGPWVLVYWERLATREEAVRRERELKGKKSRRYLEWLVSASR